MVDFTIKDSGQRAQFDSGMVRDVTEDKVDFSLIFDGPMLARWAKHLTLGAKKYDKRNWMKAAGEPELNRFIESAARHFVQWMAGDKDEDHAAAVIFNLNGAEYIRAQSRPLYGPITDRREGTALHKRMMEAGRGNASA